MEFTRKDGDVNGLYVSFREGSSLVRVPHECPRLPGPNPRPARLPRPVSRSRLWSWISQITNRLEFDVVKQQFTRWWFQNLFMFIPTWGDDPIWLNFFKGVETTNQFTCGVCLIDFFSHLWNILSILCICKEIWPFPQILGISDPKFCQASIFRA